MKIQTLWIAMLNFLGEELFEALVGSLGRINE